jgi:hypothetical protein
VGDAYTFDPVVLGDRDCDAWVHYYRHEWAPYPDNDADAAREYMRRFYALVVADGGLQLDPVEAARREVRWWHIHRVHQREDDLTETELVDAVAHLYGYVYAVPEEEVREAAHLRVAQWRSPTPG